ncbi:nucleotide-diphosphate-sugar epimerase [Dictyobacter alpinus]|uniref:Nucleotide-diphosphate-sugar epimerase n=1 Tax=Dictyobacter alpinus TaxID=2014873 RepID=A0A402BDQ5_9CHLR|nr:NmrA family NAD(P)-binding protein [Dictyobacter alpinus]GCE29485.1 nucleotide-diphosphate-sugar epimerase [Dictyobacter alpinus]
MMRSKPFFITGATGDTGKNVITMLLERGHQVRALVHHANEQSAALEKRGVEIVVGDLLDFTTLRPALEGVSGAYFVYTIAPGIIDATAYFAQAAKEAGVTTIVNMSQIFARRDAKSHAAFDHWTAERVFDWSGLAVTHLQPTLFAEWFLYYAQGIRKGLVQMPFGEGTHAPIAAEDIARVIVSILEQPAGHAGKTYPLFGPKEYTFPAAIAEIAELLGRNITYERISAEAFREQWSKMRSPFMAQHFYAIAQFYATGGFSGTNEMVEQITGHEPMGLEEFIRKNRHSFE